MPVDALLSAVAERKRVEQKLIAPQCPGPLARPREVWLARRFTAAPLRQLAPRFGLDHLERMRNLIRG